MKGVLFLVAIYGVQAAYDTCKTGLHHWISFADETYPMSGSFNLMNSYRGYAFSAGFDGVKDPAPGEPSAGVFDEFMSGLECGDKFTYPVADYCAKAIFKQVGVSFSQRKYSGLSCVGGLFSNYRTQPCANFWDSDISPKEIASQLNDKGGACCWDFLEAFNKLSCYAFTKYPQCRDPHNGEKATDWLDKDDMEAEGSTDTWKSENLPEFGDSLFTELHAIAEHAENDDLLFTVDQSTEKCMRSSIGMNNLESVRFALVNTLKQHIPFFGTLQSAIEAIRAFAEGDYAMGTAQALDAITSLVLEFVGGPAIRAVLKIAEGQIGTLIKQAAKWGINLALFTRNTTLFTDTFKNQAPCVACMLASSKLLRVEIPEAQKSGRLCGFKISGSNEDEWRVNLAHAYVTGNWATTKMKLAEKAIMSALDLKVFTASLQAYRTVRMSTVEWTEEEDKRIDQGGEKFKELAGKFSTEVTQFTASPPQIFTNPTVNQANEMLHYFAEGAAAYERSIAGQLQLLGKTRLFVARWVFGWTSADIIQGSIQLVNRTLGASVRTSIYAAAAVGRTSTTALKTISRNSLAVFSWQKDKVPETACRAVNGSTSCPLPCSGETREYLKMLCNQSTSTLLPGEFNSFSCKCKRPASPSGCDIFFGNLTAADKATVQDLGKSSCTSVNGTWSEEACQCDTRLGSNAPNITVTTAPDGTSTIVVHPAVQAPPPTASASPSNNEVSAVLVSHPLSATAPLLSFAVLCFVCWF